MTEPKIKPSPYFLSNRWKDGHDVTVDAATLVIRNPFHSEVQPDGRLRLYGWHPDYNNPIRVATSATVSAVASGMEVPVQRIVNAFQDSRARRFEQKQDP